MKKIIIFLGVLLVIVLISFTAAFMYVKANGKALLLDVLKKNSGIEATIDSVSLSFPLNVEIAGFKTGDISVQKVRVSLSPFINPFKIALGIKYLEIDKANIVVNRDSTGIYCAPFMTKPQINSVNSGSVSVVSFQSASLPSQPVKPVPIRIDHLKISNCAVKFVDNSLPVLITMDIDDINVDIKDIFLPYLSKFLIKAQAVINSQNKKIADTNINGWIDYAKKNMDLDFFVNNIDYQAFDDYYPAGWKSADLGVSKALLSFSSKMVSVNDDMDIDSKLVVDLIEFVPDPVVDGKQVIDFENKKQMVKTVLALVQGKNDKPSLPFKQKTKMSQPKLDFSSLLEYFTNSIKLDPVGVLKNIFNNVATIVVKDSQTDGQTQSDQPVGEMTKKEKRAQKINNIIGGVFSVLEQSQKEPASANQ